MFVTYKITNLITGEYYFGSHKTQNFEKDSYFGSGVKLKESVEKYGKSNFSRETIAEFGTREEAFELEKKLIAEAKPDKLCLNMNDGGSGVFIAEKLHEEYLARYNANSKHCLYCGKVIPYEQRLNGGFCSSSCAASYNNPRRNIVAQEGSRYGKRLFTCLYCGHQEWIARSNPKVYCSNKHQKLYEAEHHTVDRRSEAGKRLEENRDEILDKYRNGEKKAALARFYNVTKQMIGDYINRWTAQANNLTPQH